MKFSAVTALALGAAPAVLAKATHNVYPVRRGGAALESRPKDVSVDPSRLAGLGLSGAGITEQSLTEVIIIWANPGGNAATTTINSQVTVTQTVTVDSNNGGAAAATTTSSSGSTTSVVSGAAQTHSVTVGGSAGLAYTPNSISANVGDMVVFTFLEQNHTVTQSSFNTPCVALAGGMDSGFQPNKNNSVNPAPQVAMQVMSSGPLWFYCRQKGHCGEGMTFSINPTAAKTQAMFQSMAIAQNGTGAGTAITGGTGSSGSSSASGSAASSSTTSAIASVDTASASLAALPTGTASVDPAAASSASSSSASSSSASGVVSGTGTLVNGACQCAVFCGTAAFPAAVQGLENFGGLPGAIPSSMAVVM